MKTKLTLTIEEEIVKKAKIISKKKKSSLSKIIENFLKNFIENEQNIKITPNVLKLKGILKDKNISEKDYKKHIEEKYL